MACFGGLDDHNLGNNEDSTNDNGGGSPAKTIPTITCALILPEDGCLALKIYTFTKSTDTTENPYGKY